MNKTILLGHGSGGQLTNELIRNLFVKSFDNALLDSLADSAVTQFGNSLLAFTTDSFVVDPVFFPGGDIGKLAVCGTVNDLSVSGARPLFLSAGYILEEGLPLADLERIVQSMAEEAKRAHVTIITGDTKVVKKGQCDKVFINTSGIGFVDPVHAGISKGNAIKPGDVIVVNGHLGDHEIAILASREGLQFEEPVCSDVASLNNLIFNLLDEGVDIHFMRDITRGGLATILSEITESMHVGISIEEQALPVKEQVSGVCELYGFDPMYLANEGKVVMVVDAGSSEKALHFMHQHPLGQNGCMIGCITDEHRGKVLVKSPVGGTRLVTRLSGEQLPRIC
jgi:hydrogenase expression/formation protein HypE